MQEKGLKPEIFIVTVAEVVHLTEGNTLITDNSRQVNESPTGSKTVAQYQMDNMGTLEAGNIPHYEVCNVKPMNGKIVQMTLCESDQFIVPLKQG